MTSTLKNIQTNILAKITTRKRQFVDEAKALYPTAILEKSIHFTAPTVSMQHYLLRPDKCGIIAEIKRESPSLGPIIPYLSVEKVSIGYMQAGASALSVLTDSPFFGGSTQDLITARGFNLCPILRKDFILDEYQILEARAIGADTILLIAAILTKQEVKSFARLAQSLGLEVLLEVHRKEELDHWTPEIGLVGVNNRDLVSFRLDVQTSHNLYTALPTEVVKVSESGLKDPETVALLYQTGYRGFLIGERFLTTADPAEACAKFIKQLKPLIAA
jgi:indole-3-glycerol phosphate synthase